MQTTLDKLQAHRQSLPPTFAFVDPYGFTLSMELLNKLLSFPKSELLINFMFRFVDMAISNQDQESNLNELFGCTDWKELQNVEDYRTRVRETIHLFSQQLQARWVTQMFMRGSNNIVKYVLIHATNNSRGRELMKEAMWSIAPDGTFTAYERNDPQQLILIEPEPNLDPLKLRLWNQFAGKTVRLNEIYNWLLGELYLKTHLHKVLREYKKEAPDNFKNYEGKFAFKKNPLIHFPEHRVI